MDGQDTKSRSPSGAEPHNSYGLSHQKHTAQKPESQETQSQSPSGAEPHNSYGLVQEQHSKSNDTKHATHDSDAESQKQDGGLTSQGGGKSADVATGEDRKSTGARGSKL